MYRVRTITTGVAGTPWYTNMYFQGTARPGAQAALEAVYSFWDLINDVIYSSCLMTVENEVAIIDPATGELTGTHNFDPVIPVGGTATGDPLPFANTALLRLTTGVYADGRQIRGRINIGGMMEANSTLGRPTSALQGEIDNAVDTLLVTSAAQLGVWSRKAGTFNVALGWSTWGQWAQLRSHRD